MTDDNDRLFEAADAQPDELPAVRVEFPDGTATVDPFEPIDAAVRLD